VGEFDQYRDTYETLIDDALKFSGADQRFFTQLKANLLNPLFEKLALPGRPLKALDVGCGHGLIHPLLKGPAGTEIVGVDVAADVIDWARTHRPEFTYEAYDGEHLPFQGGQFDVAFTICVMHHVPPAAWSSFVAEMRRVVRPGGMVVVIEHNPWNPVTQRIVRTCPIDENAVLLSAPNLRGLLRSAELEGIQTQFFVFTPFKNSLARSLDRILQHVPIGAQYMTTARVPAAKQEISR